MKPKDALGTSIGAQHPSPSAGWSSDPMSVASHDILEQIQQFLAQSTITTQSFSTPSCNAFDQLSKRGIGTGHRNIDLYYFDWFDLSSERRTGRASAAVLDESMVWHQQLGHISSSGLQHLMSTDNFRVQVFVSKGVSQLQASQKSCLNFHVESC